MQETHQGRGKRFGAPLLLSILALAGVACHRVPAEQAIRNTISGMQAAGEKQDIDGVIGPVADDFAGHSEDDEMNFDRKQLKQFLAFLQMQKGGTVHATLGPITIALLGSDRATADFSMLVTGGTGLIPNDGQAEQMRTGWRLDGSHWKLISADWKMGGAGK